MKTILLLTLLLGPLSVFADDDCREFFGGSHHDDVVHFPDVYPCRDFDVRVYPSAFGTVTVSTHHYTENWSANAGDMLMLQAMSEAATDAMAVLGQYPGIMPKNIKILFLNDIASEERRADSSLTGHTCHIRAFYNLSDDTVANIKSTIVHEIHHCYLKTDLIGGTPSEREPYVRWMVEGMAQEFKNVVYPTVNHEWAHTKLYNPKLPIYKNQPYSASLFFQSWKNSGIELILAQMSLTHTVKAKTEKEYVKMLSETTGIADAFLRFMEDFFHGTIRDTGFGYVPTMKMTPDVKMDLKAENQVIEYAAQPFSATTFSLRAPPKGKYTFSIDPSFHNFGFRLAVKPVSAKSFMHSTPQSPASITVNCDESFRNIAVVITNTDANAADTIVPTLQIDYEEVGDDVECPCKITKLPIDKCLQDEWIGDNVAYGEELARQVNDGAYGSMTEIQIGGQYRMHFEDEDAGEALGINQIVSAIIPAAGFRLTYDQTSNYHLKFRFSQQGPGRFCVDPLSFTGSAHLNVGGEESDIDLGGLINSVPGSDKVTEVSYRCEPHKLTLYYKNEGRNSSAEWIYHR